LINPFFVESPSIAFLTDNALTLSLKPSPNGRLGQQRQQKPMRTQPCVFTNATAFRLESTGVPEKKTVKPRAETPNKKLPNVLSSPKIQQCEVVTPSRSATFRSNDSIQKKLYVFDLDLEKNVKIQHVYASSKIGGLPG
jgi:hypothetical protein